ncbi:hypothetical protein ACJX0J_025427, partial [Zea mays]
TTEASKQLENINFLLYWKQQTCNMLTQNYKLRARIISRRLLRHNFILIIPSDDGNKWEAHEECPPGIRALVFQTSSDLHLGHALIISSKMAIFILAFFVVLVYGRKKTICYIRFSALVILYIRGGHS